MAMPPRLQDRAVRALLRIYGTSARCLQSRHGLLLRQPAARLASSLPARRPSAEAQDGRDSSLLVGRPRRGYATTAAAPAPAPAPAGAPREIAVLGGGLTGLTTAFYLNKFLPSAKITIYEAGQRLGGWVDSKRYEDGDRAGIFERGPRTVAGQGMQARYDDLVLYELLQELELQSKIFNIPRGEAGLPNRYIYYPDHLVNVSPPMPNGKNLAADLRAIGNLFELLTTEPLAKGAIPSIFNYLTGKGQRPLPPHSKPPGAAIATDESIGDFFLRRLGRREPIDNALSALVHGIYGGDVWKLSVAQSPFAGLWLDDALKARGMPRKRHLLYSRDLDLFEDLYYTRDAEYRQMVKNSMSFGLIGFPDGFGTLTDALAKKLRAEAKVKIKMGDPVTDLSYDNKSKRVKIKTRSSKTVASYDKVISTLLAKTLHGVTSGALPSLRNERAASIMLVNLSYPRAALNHPHRGFGYLIPSSVPYDLNPECALGVIFDSDREAAHRPPRDPRTGDPYAAGGTKLTVMLGGHHWDWMPLDRWPSPDEAAAMARAVVARHLGIAPDEPCHAEAKLCADCIPQQLVGHGIRMRGARAELGAAFPGGALGVAGPSYAPPGVLTSLRSARDAAMQAAGGGYRTGRGRSKMAHVDGTGLGQFRGDGDDDDGGETLLGSDRLPCRFGNAEGLYPEE